MKQWQKEQIKQRIKLYCWTCFLTITTTNGYGCIRCADYSEAYTSLSVTSGYLWALSYFKITTQIGIKACSIAWF